MITDVLPIDVFWSLLCALSVAPVGYMLGSSCSPCCGPQECGVADGKPRTDPATEGHWVPSGTWPSVTWTFSSSPSTNDGGTWFFYGSAGTSKVGGSASVTEQRDWNNICNWYSNKTTTPNSTSSITTVLDKRATRLPPSDAIVHVYSALDTSGTGGVTVKNAYFWGTALVNSVLTATGFRHGTTAGVFFSAGESSGSTVNGGAFFSNSENRLSSTVNGGAVFLNSDNTNASTVNGGAILNGFSLNEDSSVINDGAIFNGTSQNNDATVNDGATFNGGATFSVSPANTFSGIVNGGATFNGASRNSLSATVNGGAVFNDTSRNTDSAVVNGGAFFNDTSRNTVSATVNDGAEFNGTSRNESSATVNGGATFNDTSLNILSSVVNNGATFNGSSVNSTTGVNGGATFNDSACSTVTTGTFANCPGAGKRIFVAHPTDLPTCNGTAPAGCVNAADTCGCG